MQQYAQVKVKYPDAILLFRGRFYETFGEDAVKSKSGAGDYGTSRNNGGSDIELAGFPSFAGYVFAEIGESGLPAAICEQMEKPCPGKWCVVTLPKWLPRVLPPTTPCWITTAIIFWQRWFMAPKSTSDSLFWIFPPENSFVTEGYRHRR